MKKQLRAAAIAAIVSLAGPSLAYAADALVYKSPTCGCCDGWVDHLRANGLEVDARNVSNVNAFKLRYGVPARLASCHTAVIDGYVIEGHVPAADIRRLLAERPDVAGLAVSGMPAGSPGMSGEPQPYNVIAFDRGGALEVFARH